MKSCHNQPIFHGNPSKWSLWKALFVLAHFRALCSSTNHFPFYLFLYIINDTHIIGSPLIISFTHEHFQIALCAIGLFIQPQNWSPFSLPPNFNTPSQFTTPLKGIQDLGVLLDISSFTSSFIKDALLEVVRHVDFFSRMGDVQVAFGILIHCFMQCPSYFLWCTPPFSTFTKSFISFDSSFLYMFGCLLSLRSFDSPKGLLACKQTFLLIIFSGIGLILTTHHHPSNLFRELGPCSFSHSY
jgi:hypothetical protein